MSGSVEINLLYSINDDILYVKENTFSPKKFIEIVFDKALSHGIEKICAFLPAYYDLKSDKTEIIKSGMLLPLCGDAENLIKTIENAYLGLTLD